MKKIEYTKYCKDMKGLGLIYPAHRNVNMYNPLWKDWQFLKKLIIHVPYDPAILSLSIYEKVMNTYDQTKTCNKNIQNGFLWNSCFLTWKQFKFPSKVAWKNKLCCVYKVECCPTIWTKWAIDTCNKTNHFQNDYARWEKPARKREHAVYKIHKKFINV